MAVLRAVIGVFFVGHGAQKLFGKFGGPGPDGAAEMMEETVGVTPGKPMALAAGGAELAGGALLALGLATPLAAGMLSGVMSGAIAGVHGENGPCAPEGGYEYNVVMIAALLAIAGSGPGRYSLDRVLGTERRGALVGFASVGAGALAGVANIAAGRKLRERELAAA